MNLEQIIHTLLEKLGIKTLVYKGKYLAKLCEHSSLPSSKAKNLVYKLGLKENKCEITEWLGKPLVCELHHINGDSTDNRIENLQILCPNCQTDNFRSRNRSKGNEHQDEKSLA